MSSPYNQRPLYPQAPNNLPYPDHQNSQFPSGPGFSLYPSSVPSAPYPSSMNSPYGSPGQPYMPSGQPYGPPGSQAYMTAPGQTYVSSSGQPYIPSTGQPYVPSTGQPYNPSTGQPYASPSGQPYPPSQFKPYEAPQYVPYNPPYMIDPHFAAGVPRPPYNPQNYTEPPVTTPPQTNTPKMAYMEQGTVVEYQPFQPDEDAQVLRKAMKGFGTDEKAIINVLARRTNMQRLYIISSFKTLFGKELIKDLKSELSGKFEDVILALMQPLAQYLARELHSAISGLGTDEDVLVEIMGTHNNAEIRAINEAYYTLFGSTLESDLMGDTSGHFRRLMVSLSTAGRDEYVVDPERARHDAKVLLDAGESQWGTDESTFNAILVSQSYSQLRMIFYEYYQLTGRTLEQAIQSEMSGDLKNGMLAIVKSVESRPAYFAEKLYKAMKGMGTDDRTLIRVVTSRCEIDMVQIKEAYEATYGVSLAQSIADDTSGDYKRVLLALIA